VADIACHCVAWQVLRLSIPGDVDASLGLTISDDASIHYRALIFPNGWNVGQYINDVGPQTTFVFLSGRL
jgi:hypothetical protein